jgi:hypothetical protein
MLRTVIAVVFVIGALAALATAAPVLSVQSVDQRASPAAGTPSAGPTPTAELCTAGEIAKGDTGIVVEPPGEAGVVPFVDTLDYRLWVVQITIPPQSCRAFQSPGSFVPQHGPIVIFVHSGSIEYGVHSATTPPATVTMGHQDAVPFQPVPPDTLVPLHSGDWVTQDGAAWFTYRNLGPGSAVISMAGFVVESGERCSGGCRGKG